VLLEPQAVGRFGWLTTAQFRDGGDLSAASSGWSSSASRPEPSEPRSD